MELKQENTQTKITYTFSGGIIRHHTSPNKVKRFGPITTQINGEGVMAIYS